MRPSQKSQNPLRGRTRPGARQGLPRTEHGVNVKLPKLPVTSHTNTPCSSHLGTQRPLGTSLPVTDMHMLSRVHSPLTRRYLYLQSHTDPAMY